MNFAKELEKMLDLYEDMLEMQADDFDAWHHISEACEERIIDMLKNG